MKVFVAGATGVVGRQLVPRLVADGHVVFGMTRSRFSRHVLRALGATPVVADALDRDAVLNAVLSVEPEVVVHELTALSKPPGMRHFARDMALTNRLRTEGTDHLLAAARSVGARRFVAQSFAGWPFARVGGPVKTEEDPLGPPPTKAMRTTLDAIRHLENAVTGATWTEGVVLRYGNLYGPRTWLGPSGVHLEMIRKRKFPVVGGGGGVWSFVHVDDAADATGIAVARGRRGIYDVVDDDPAAVAEWLPAIAHAVGAATPRRLPLWLGRLVAGETATIMMTEVRGASNKKAKRDLGWQPAHPTWRQGFTREAA